MFKKIFKFILGYVIIEVTGKNRERFVSMCLHNNLAVCNIVPTENGLMLEILCEDFFHIRRPARKCGVRVRIKSKRGLKRFARRYRRRYGFLAAGAAVCIFFLIVPHYIWCVEIEGLYYADKQQILDILREHGVYAGARKSGIDDLSEIKDAIVYGVDGVNWAWLYTDGARCRLQIQEQAKAPEIDDRTTPTDIIAACDGWIERADVMHGERRVTKGMNVNAGDVLVSGKVAVFKDGYPEKYMYERSQAEIIAETIRHESGLFGKNETLRIKTGRISKRYSIELFGRCFDLFRDINCGYEDSDITSERHDLVIPFLEDCGISVITYTVYDVKESQRELSEQEVLERAKEQLEERICKSLSVGAVKTDERLTYNADGDSYRVELRMRLKENIGIEVPIKE